MLVTNKDLMVPARKGGYAVGAFNVYNLESVLAVAEAATEERSPVIFAITASALKYAGFSYLTGLVKTAAQLSPVPMSMHLDHGEDVDIISKCLESGFTSVMIDGSFLTFEENVALTKKVVTLAHSKGVSVEAELGKIAGVEEYTVEEREAVLTDPDAAAEFVERTGVDALAVAIGTSHGAYKFKSQMELDIERLRRISEKTNVPFVLHGASSVPQWLVDKASKYGAQLSGAKGINEDQYTQAIPLGIAKINIDTDLRLAFTATIREIFSEKPQEFNPRSLLGAAKNAMKQVAKAKMQLFSSTGKA